MIDAIERANNMRKRRELLQTIMLNTMMLHGPGIPYSGKDLCERIATLTNVNPYEVQEVLWNLLLDTKLVFTDNLDITLP